VLSIFTTLFLSLVSITSPLSRQALEKCVGHILKIWAPLRKLFSHLGVPRWLRACQQVPIFHTYPGEGPAPDLGGGPPPCWCV